MLHVAVSDNAGHAFPPCLGFVETVRVLFFVPPPHALEQDEYELQPLTAQSTFGSGLKVKGVAAGLGLLK